TNKFGAIAGTYETAVAFAIGSIIYVSSFVVQRASTESPPMRVAAVVPSRAVVGYEPSLWPHSMYWFPGRAYRIENALQRLMDRPDVRLYEYLNGPTDLPGSRSFAWQNSDAY